MEFEDLLNLYREKEKNARKTISKITGKLKTTNDNQYSSSKD